MRGAGLRRAQSSRAEGVFLLFLDTRHSPLSHLRKTRQAEIEAWLKHDMLERGMTAEDIRTVLEARIDGEETRLAHVAGQGGVQLGLGKFHNVGNKQEPASTPG